MKDAAISAAEVLLPILEQHPKGISEYELINTLQRVDASLIPENVFDRPEVTFRIHFLLFHGLYHLQAQLVEQGRAHLEISPLRIVLQPYESARAQELTQHDALRDYYLDLDNLAQTTEADVLEMLAAFWRRLQCGDERETALAVLGLSDPVDDATIRRQYRRLVMRHHPDRGGETARLQEIHGAVAVLLPGRRTGRPPGGPG